MAYPADLAVTAFDGPVLLATGSLADVVLDVLRHRARAPDASPVVFCDETGERLELTWEGSEADALMQLAPARSRPLPPASSPPTARAPGRPRLGVVAREVTLLPRHWDWLATQPGGASATLRRLLDDARRQADVRAALRRAQESAYRFMLTAGSHLPGYEEALRALFAGDTAGFEAQLASWPADWRAYAMRLAFGGAPGRLD